MTLIRIGTRTSKLAKIQARIVRNALLIAHPQLNENDISITTYMTTGDRFKKESLATMGGKGLFTKEIEEALLANEIDMAVHSMKDMPGTMPNGLAITALLPRDDPRDALVSVDSHASLQALPQGARMGTSSLRRQAFSLLQRPDLQVVPFRGNVTTRLDKLSQGQVDATLLAVAGLERLAIPVDHYSPLAIDTMLPAIAQGAMGIQTRTSDDRMRLFSAALNDADTWDSIAAERAFMVALGGSCRTPIAAYATLQGDDLWLRCRVAAPDGSATHVTERRGLRADAYLLGEDAAHECRVAGRAYLPGEC